MHTLLLSLLFACGEKKAEVEVATPVESTPAEEVVEETTEEPALPEIAPPPEPNVNFNATLTFSDGSTKSGHVIRVERSSDFYGMKEWLDSESKLIIYGESGSTAKEMTWTDIKTITVAPKSGDISCVYESDWTPWLYVCTNKTTSSLVDSAGKKWGVDSKHKWKFFFEDEEVVEFWIQNFRTLQQDTVEVGLGMEAYENPELYAQLQNELRNTVYVKSVNVQ